MLCVVDGLVASVTNDLCFRHLSLKGTKNVADTRLIELMA